MTDHPAAAIVTEDLTKHFRRFGSRGPVRAVDGISLEVATGSAFGLLGPNGSGKTTFIKLLLSAARPTSGRARLFGLDCRKAEARRPVGYLPENHRFPTYNTGRQMLHSYAALSGARVRNTGNDPQSCSNASGSPTGQMSASVSIRKACYSGSGLRRR